MIIYVVYWIYRSLEMDQSDSINKPSTASTSGTTSSSHSTAKSISSVSRYIQSKACIKSCAESLSFFYSVQLKGDDEKMGDIKSISSGYVILAIIGVHHMAGNFPGPIFADGQSLKFSCFNFHMIMPV